MPPEALHDPTFFAREGALRGLRYRLPPFLDDTLAGVGAATAGVTVAYYNVQHALTIADRVLPAATSTWSTRAYRGEEDAAHIIAGWLGLTCLSAASAARRALVPLLGLPPLALVTAACAGLGYGLLPSVVELAADLFYGTSGAMTGAVADVKKRGLAAAPPHTDGGTPPEPAPPRRP